MIGAENIKKRSKRRPKDYGDDPHSADFGPEVTIDDINPVWIEAKLTVGQRQIIKSVPSDSIKR